MSFLHLIVNEREISLILLFLLIYARKLLFAKTIHMQVNMEKYA